MENLVSGWVPRGKQRRRLFVSARRAETAKGERAEGMTR